MYTTLRLATVSQRLGMRVGVFLLAVAGIVGSLARAQISGTGAISGTVQDPSGAVIANAVVTATNVGTNVQTVRTTTSAGDFNITPLLPGTYRVTVSAQGFEGFNQENVTVDALVTVGLNVKMTVGRADETVTITAAPPLLSTQDATLGGVMDNQMYSNLPIQMGQGGNNDQRRVTDFEYLMPGVQANFTSNNATSNSGIVNGSGPSGGVSEVYIDGVDLPEADQVGDPRFTWTAIGVDAIDQFQVQTAGVSAQYGGQGVQNYSIKSGGNAYHGSIYEYLRNTIFDAWRFTDKIPTTVAPPPGTAPSTCAFGSPASASCVPGGVKPREIQNEFGIVLNGPILKNRLFLFGNYGQYRNQNGAKAATMTIPTAAMLGYTPTGTPLGYADFSGYAVANGSKTCTDTSKVGVTANGCVDIYDPTTQIAGCTGTASSPCVRTVFPGIKNGVPTADVIPSNRISGPAAAYSKFLLPYELLASQTTFTNNLAYGTPTGLANWYSTGSIDYAQNARNQVRLLIAFGRQSSTGPNNLSGLGPPFNVSQTFTPVTTVDILKDSFTINSHLVNQFAIGYGRYQSDSVTPNRQPQYAAAGAGILNMPAGQASDGFPGITFTGTFTTPSQGTFNTNTVWGGYAWNNKINNTYTLTDNLQWVVNKHNLTIGFQIVDAQFNYYKVLSPSGPMAFTFNQQQTEAFSSGTSLNAATGSSVASYMLGAASAGSTSANVPGLGTRWFDPSFWVEDDYKVNSKLTLNLGLRWDVYPSIKEAHNIFTFLNPNGINSITGNRGTLEFAGTGDPALYCNCKSPSPISFKTIAPRFGMAWSVNPKTVVRGSYNVNFARGDWTSGSQSGSPSTLGLTPAASAPASISSAPEFYWDATGCTNGTFDGVACGWNGSVTPPTPPAGGTSLAEYATTNTNALGTSGGATQTYFDPYRGSRTPEYINWTFGVQRQVTRDMSITVSYVGSQGHFLNGGYANPGRTNHLTENYALLSGYNTNGTTATPCSGPTCGVGTGITTLLGAKATPANIASVNGLGFTPPNPYSVAPGTANAYYAGNSVTGYYTAFPQFSGVSDTTNFNGNTNFHALEISLRQRAAHGLDFMMNYTYSKSMDDLGTFRVYDNPRLDRSLSVTDQPQNLTLSGVYQLPFGHGHFGGNNFLVDALAGGWSLSSIFSYHSGTPLVVTGSGCGGTVLSQCMPNAAPGVAARQNAYGKNITAANGSPNYYATKQFLNPAAFTVNNAGNVSASSLGNYGTLSGNNNQIFNVGNGPALYVPGNAARVGQDNVWSMSLYNVDFGLKRVFPIYENIKLQFEADMLNATNHVVWGAVNGGVGGASYGYVTSLANQPRDFQLSGRLNW